MIHRRDLLKGIQESVARDRIIVPGVVKRHRASWPICLTCGREPFSVNLEDAGKNRVEVRVKCYHKNFHEASDSDRIFEDYAIIDIPFGADREEHIGWALRSLSWFDPTRPAK